MAWKSMPKFSTIDGKKVSSVQVPDDLRMDKDGNVPNQTIKVGKQQMDGRTLLNYARFRKDDEGDYGRYQAATTSDASYYEAS